MSKSKAQKVQTVVVKPGQGIRIVRPDGHCLYEQIPNDSKSLLNDFIVEDFANEHVFRAKEFLEAREAVYNFKKYMKAVGTINGVKVHPDSSVCVDVKLFDEDFELNLNMSLQRNLLSLFGNYDPVVSFDFNRQTDPLLKVLSGDICSDWPSETFADIALKLYQNFRKCNERELFENVFSSPKMETFVLLFTEVLEKIKALNSFLSNGYSSEWKKLILEEYEFVSKPELEEACYDILQEVETYCNDEGFPTYKNS